METDPVWAMGHLSLLFLVTLSLSDCAASLVVLADSSYCIHLGCEWRGLGKHCRPATRFRRANQDDRGFFYPFLSDDESPASILERIQAEYPVNTFTIVKDIGVGEQCARRGLLCNSEWMYIEDDYDSFLKLQHSPPAYTVPPKLHCRPSLSRKH